MKEILTWQDLDNFYDDRVIDNMKYIRDLIVLCDGDIRTSEKLNKKFGNQIYDITNQLIKLVKEMQREKISDKDCAYKKLFSSI